MSISFFACGNTAKGFCNFFNTNIQQLKRLFILKGGPGTGKATLIRKLGEELEELGYDIEYIYCCSDPDSLDGILVPKLKVGIVDGTLLRNIQPTASEAIEEFVNLEIAWDTNKLAIHTIEILNEQNKIREFYEKAYEDFAQGLRVHDEWEKIYIENMNFSKANELTDKIISIIFGNNCFNKKSCIKHRFFGGSTPYGPMDFVEDITKNIGRRYFIKGRPGSGKSTMLKKILARAEELGINTEVYHCGFDPDSLDMLLFSELNICIFDSTAPHEYFPNREGDYVIDMYAELIKPHTDEDHEAELTDIVARYKLFTQKGTAKLALAKEYHDKLEKFYIEATDFALMDQIYVEIRNKFMKYHHENSLLEGIS